jgi:hypothetical protein
VSTRYPALWILEIKNMKKALYILWILITWHDGFAERYSCGPFSFTNDSVIVYPQFNVASGYLHQVTIELENGFFSEELTVDNDSTNSTLLNITMGDSFHVWIIPGSGEAHPVTNPPPIIAETHLFFYESGTLFNVSRGFDQRFNSIDDGDGSGGRNGGSDELSFATSVTNIQGNSLLLNPSCLAAHTGSSTLGMYVKKFLSYCQFGGVIFNANWNIELFRTNTVCSGKILIHYDYNQYPLSPTIKSPELVDGMLEFDIQNLSIYSTNTLQYTYNLLSNDWKDVSSFISGSSQNLLSLPIESNSPACYYRVISR